MAMPELDIRFIPFAEMTPDLQNQFDALDHLAFEGDGDKEDPEFSGIQWASPDWMELGFLQDMLVTQLCLPKRKILAGSHEVWVAGIGGMATHPKFQHQGFGSQLLSAAEDFMRDTIQLPFGLLICAQETRPFYERSRWELVSDMLYYVQDGRRLSFKTPVMVLPLTERSWPPGEIDLCGLPW